MSIRTKNIDVSNYQRFSGRVEFRFYDNQLYICKVEDNGQILQGATISIDALPAAAIYGSNGSAQSFVLSSEVNLDVDLSLLSSDDREELEDALKTSILAGINIEGAIVIIESFTSI